MTRANGAAPYAVDADGMIPFAEFDPDEDVLGGADAWRRSTTG